MNEITGMITRMRQREERRGIVREQNMGHQTFSHHYSGETNIIHNVGQQSRSVQPFQLLPIALCVYIPSLRRIRTVITTFYSGTMTIQCQCASGLLPHRRPLPLFLGLKVETETPVKPGQQEKNVPSIGVRRVESDSDEKGDIALDGIRLGRSKESSA